SHELRTPLNAIIGYSEMLREEMQDENNQEYVEDLEKIRAAGKHLLELINSILDLSKIEAGKMELHLSTFNVAALIEDTKIIVVPLVEKKRNKLIIECPENIGNLHADEMKLRQSLFNLL